MRKFIAILCTITLLASTVSVSGATASDGDKDGDVVANPWADLFTTAAAEVTTQDVETTAVAETTTQGTSGDDYSSLTYTTVSCDGGADLEYCVVSQNIEGWGTPWYGDAGNTFQMVYAGGEINPAESTTVKVNGVETAEGTGAVTVVGAGLMKLNPTQMADNAYTAVEITTATGSALVVFKKGTPGTSVVETTAVVETTTEEVTTTAKPVETTTVAEETTTVVEETTTQGTSGDDYSSLTYTTVSCDGGADLEYCVVSQDIEGWGTPWYGDAGNTFQMVYAGGDINPAESTTVKVNGVETEQGSGVVSVVAAGLIKVNPTQMSDNAYTAVEITTATGSALVVFKKGTPGTAPVETTTEEVTTTVKPAETTTVAVETTTEEDTTVAEETTTEKATSSYDPGFNPSLLTYTNLACTGTEGLSIDYSIYESNVAGLAPWYGDGGNTFMLQFSADAGVVSGITINGETPADGVITETATGLVKINPTTFADDAYTIIEVTTENGDFTVVVKKGTPAEIPTVTTEAPETTTVAEETTTEDVTTTVAVETTTEKDETTATNPAETTTEEATTVVEETTTKTPSGYNPGFDPSSLTYTTIECDGQSDLALDYSIYESEVAGLVPWYGDGGNTFMLQYSGDSGKATAVKINGETPADGVVTETATGLVKINPTTFADDAYTVIEVTTEKGDFTVVVKKGTPAEVPTVTTQATETTTVAGETTTEDVTTDVVETTTVAGETTTEDVTTDVVETTTAKVPSGYNPGFDPSSLTYTTIECDGQSDLALDYSIYESSVAGLVPWYGDGGNTFMLQFSGDAGVVSGITINGETPADGVITETATGLIKVNPTTFADDAYTVIEVTTENGDFTVVVKKGTPAEVPTVTTQAVETTTEEVTTDTVETTTEEATTEAPTTEAPTTEAPTTEAPTTQKPTTVAPTTAAPTTQKPTTVAPTTTQKATVVKVAKSKVKKATKKKSAKKIKISLKKIKGAKYQIQISKAKKFKKKNILVKKNVKKAKVTIKSKKIKNKKKLYVRVRAYKVVNGKKYYSKWSKAKKAKIK